MRPKVSVVMPVFNSESWLPETLESLASQDFKDWELIAIDDGSTDSSLEILNKFMALSSNRVRVFEQENQGPSVARNRGVAESEGDLVALLDSDDLWHESKLSKQVELLERNQQIVGTVCGYQILSMSTRSVIARRTFSWDKKSLVAWALMESYSPCLCSTLVIKRDALISIGGFNQEMTNVEDLELAFRIHLLGKVGSVEAILMTYRLTPNQNHRNLATIIRDYATFVRGWEDVSKSELARARSNLRFLRATDDFRRHHFRLAVVHSLRGFAIAPLQGFRLVLGKRQRRIGDSGV